MFFDERAGIAEFDGGLPRADAEARAFECCVVKWLDRNPAPSTPGQCASCGRADAVVVPYGTEPEPTHGYILNAGQRGTPGERAKQLHR